LVILQARSKAYGNMSTPEEMEIYLTNTFQLDDDDLVIALFEQRLDTMKGYSMLTLDDITRIRSNVRRPGGMIIGEDGELVVNRGQQVSAVLEKRLKQFWFFVHNAYMTQRDPDFQTGDGVPELAELANLDSYRNSFPLAKDVESPPQFPGQEKARKWFEQFDTWAGKTIGPSGVPLFYVLRKEAVVVGMDPG
jgi:hypothetical protein